MTPIYTHLQRCSFDTADWNCSCCKCTELNKPSVCHRLLSISWLLLPVCWQTRECVACRCTPDKGSSGRFESKLYNILTLFPVPPSWNCDRRYKVWRIYRTAHFLDLSIHSTVRRISSEPNSDVCVHFSRTKQLLRSSCGRQWSEHVSVLVEELFGAYIHVECIPSKLDLSTAWVSPDQLVSSIFSTWVTGCALSLPSKCRPRTRIEDTHLFLQK